MSSYQPRLRPHLHVDGDRLVDTLLDRRFPLQGTVAALAPMLDGERSWDAIRAALAADGFEEDDIASSLRGLYCLGFVEGSGDALAARLEAVVCRTIQVPTSLMEGARFACQGSGGCCTGYAIGPLTEADVTRIEALDLAAAFPHLSAPWFDEIEGSHYLRRVHSHCVFLADDRRCGLHAAFGPDSKPALCRLYPLDSFATVEGIRIVDRGTCASFGVSARKGLPLADDLDRVRPLLDAPMLHHPLVHVDGRPWDYGLFLRFTTAATDLVKRRVSTATHTLAALGRLLGALARAVHACPLEPGQPDGVVDATLVPDDDGRWYEPDPQAEASGLRRLAVLLGELTPAMAQAAEDRVSAAAVSRFRDMIALLEHASERIEVHDGAAPEVVHADDVDDALRISLRQQLFGRNVVLQHHAGTGLVRIGLVQLLALAGARLDAGARPLTAADLSRGHHAAMRVFESGSLNALLLRHEARWRELVAGIAAAGRIVSA
ncbi:MAG TPA: YkgJ family cysteine cluster protein [Kofleriaceae bacterium]|nr:YkgJ family cysteine cluster protein [Kofleriaceae bacterium]